MTSPAAELLDFVLGPLQPWLADPATEDISMQKPGEAWIYRRGSWIRVEVQLGIEDLEEIATLSAALRRQEIGHHAPLAATELPGGERLQICLPPAVPTGTISLTVRKHQQNVLPLFMAHRRYDSNDWNQWSVSRSRRDLSGLLALYDAGDLEAFLGEAVRCRLNIILCGPTGSGKTTLSASLLGAIDPHDRLITIEDALELTIAQPNTVRLLYSKDGLQGSALDAGTLLEASLRMRPHRVILQELRDAAAFTYMSAVCSGHPGSVTTVHGASAEDAVRRLFILAKSSPNGAALDDRTLARLISAAVEIIVPLHERGGTFGIGSVWFFADAERRGTTAADLLR